MTQPRGRPTVREEQRALTRRRIIDAAVAQFNSRSALEVTVEDIARSAGVTRPTVYAHFARIADIVDAMLDELYALGDTVFGQLVDLPEWTPATVGAWLGGVADCYHAEAAKLRVTSLAGVVPDQATAVSRHRGYIDLLTSGPRWRRLPPAEAEHRAFMLVLMVESFFMVRITGAWQLRHGDPMTLLTESVLNLLPPPVLAADESRAQCSEGSRE